MQMPFSDLFKTTKAKKSKNKKNKGKDGTDNKVTSDDVTSSQPEAELQVCRLFGLDCPNGLEGVGNGARSSVVEVWWVVSGIGGVCHMYVCVVVAMVISRRT